MTKLDRVNPFAEQDVTQQLDSWSAALEMAVATLNQTLAELKAFQKGVPDVGPEPPEQPAVEQPGDGQDG